MLVLEEGRAWVQTYCWLVVFLTVLSEHFFPRKMSEGPYSSWVEAFKAIFAVFNQLKERGLAVKHDCFDPLTTGDTVIRCFYVAKLIQIVMVGLAKLGHSLSLMFVRVIGMLDLVVQV